MKVSIVALMFVFANWAYAGSADAIIKGRTGTGRTQLEIRVLDIDADVQFLKFTVDGKSLELSDFSGGGFGSVVCDRKNKVYTVSVRSAHAEFKFWMIPNSLKIERGDHREKWTFTAIAVGTDPRLEGGWRLTPEIEMPCTLEWSL